MSETGWSPGGHRRKKIRKEKYLELQQRRYVRGLSSHRFKALQKVLEDGERPDDLPLPLWDRIKEAGALAVDVIRGKP